MHGGIPAPRDGFPRERGHRPGRTHEKNEPDHLHGDGLGGFCFVHNLKDTHIRPASKPEGPQKEKVKVRQAHIVMKKLVRCADSMDTWCAEMRQCARGVSLAFHMSIGIPPGTGQASGLHMDAAALEAEEAGPGTHSGYRSLNAFCVYQRRRLPMRRPWPPVIRPLRQPPLAGRAEHAIPVRRAARLSPCFIWKIATAQSPCPCF